MVGIILREKIKVVLFKISDLVKKKFVIDVIWNFGSTLIIGISGMLLNVIIGNFYNAEGFGIFSRVLAIYMVLSIIAVFGIQTSILKSTAEHKDSKEAQSQSTSMSLLIVFVISIALTIIVFLVATFFAEVFGSVEINRLTKIIIWGLPLFSLNKVLFGFINGLRKMRFYAMTQSFRWIFLLAYVFIISEIYGNLELVLLAFPLTEAVLFLILLFFTSRFISISFSNFKRWLKEHIVFGSKSVLTDSTAELNSQIGVLIVGYLLSNYYAGIYNFASTIAKGLLMITSVIQLNFNPIFSSLWAQKDMDSLNNYISKIKKITLLIIPIFLSTAILYPIFVFLLMKNPTSYLPSFPVFYILLAGIALSSLFIWSGGMLSMAGYPGMSLILITIVFLFNLSASITLVTIFGVNGAAIASSLSYLVMVMLIIYFTKKKLGIDLILKRPLQKGWQVPRT